MRAVRFHRQGPPEVLVLDELPGPEPEPGPHEALLDVRAAGVNHLDVFVRRSLPRIPLPRIPGADAAGLVRAVGPLVTRLTTGQPVLVDPGLSCGECLECARGEPTFCRQYRILGEGCDGTYRDRLLVPARNCLPVPEGWTFAQAAAFPLVALTAWRMCVVRGGLRAGEDVLVHGGAAGVGTMVIQIAKMAGCRVFATASTPEKRALCERLGAEHVYDPAAQPDWVQDLKARTAFGRGVDVVVDYVGRATWLGSLRATRNGGRILTCGATSGHDPQEDLRQIFFRQISVIGSTMGSRADLAAALRAAERGLLKPVLAATLPLAAAAEAHRMLEERRAPGKIVLEVPE
jgi:NADPH:quinone reductase-like Zn-dependent oxidoreductase